MTIGESGLALIFAATAFLCMIGAAKAVDAPFAFHASLAAAASVAAVFAILNRYFDRPAQLPPQEINGRPNYNLGPIKFSTFMAMFWGIAGFLVGLIIASQLAWPSLNLEPWLNFGRLRPLHTSAVIFAFGGNVIDEVDVDPVMDDDIVHAVLRVNLLPEFDPVFETLTRKFQSFGQGRGGQRQYYYD